MSVAGTLQRRWIPRAVVALSTVRRPARTVAAARRALGRRGTVELYVAFDDPYSAVALLGLADRLAGRRVDLLVRPVVARGIPGDPAVEAKRRYAVVDAARLAGRDGRRLSRSAPVEPPATAFLARWAAAGPARVRTAFCVDAMRELWLGSDGEIDEQRYAALWRAHAGAAPDEGDRGLRAAQRRMRRRRLYDTPVAVVHGQWFFAHERLAAIEHRLDELGWVSAR